jgi:hypothetical protein
MFKVNVMMNIYEEKDHILLSLESVKRIAKKIYILDGTVKLFPAKPDYNSYAESPASRDGTIELIKEWAKKAPVPVSLWESREIWESEADKKNWLLSKIPIGEYVLILDGDEELYAAYDFQPDGVSDYQTVTLFTGHASFAPFSFKAYYSPRLWINQPNRRFRNPSKDQLVTGWGERGYGVKPVSNPPLPFARKEEFSGSQKLAEKGGMPASEGKVAPLWFLNNPTVRNIERQKRRLIYYQRLFGVKFL